MKYAQLKVPGALWVQCEAKAEVFGKSVTAFANDCIKDSIERSHVKEPRIPEVVGFYHFLNKQGDSPIQLI